MTEYATALARAARIAGCMLFLSFPITALAERTGLTIIEGDSWREYDTHAVPFSYALVSSRPRSIGNSQLPVFTTVRTFPSANKTCRIHVPLSIVVRQGTRCDNATLAYAFSFATRSGRRTKPPIAVTDFRWVDIPLSPGPNEWTLTSDWMVECDKQFTREDEGYLVEKSSGELVVRQKVGKDDKVISTVAALLFPFQIGYWSPRRGMAGKWIESEFPNLVLRDVTGDEQFIGVHYMIFTDDPDYPFAGNIATSALATIVQSAMKDWKNPYDPGPSYTNTIDEQPWATNLAIIEDQALAGAYLAHQLRRDDSNSDAADLLLRNLVERGEAELAARTYARCQRQFPAWHEYWLGIYLPAVQKADDRRAILVAYLRDHPDSIFAMTKLASSYMGDEQWRLAKKMIGRIIELQPSNVPARTMLATVTQHEGLASEALTERAKVIRLLQPIDPALTGFYGRGTAPYRKYLLGDAALNASNIERGVVLLRGALSADPTYFPALLRIADHYERAGVVASARANYLDALNAAPGQPKAISGLAALHQASAKTTSVRKYQDLLWSVLKPVADEELRVRNWTNVVSITQCMLAGYPGHAEAFSMYVSALLRLGLYEEATTALYRMPDDRRNPDIIALWADACRIIDADQHVIVLADTPIGWRQRALSAWTDVIKLEPNAARAYLERALIYLDEGDIGRAYPALRELYKLRRSPELALWIAELCLAKAEERPNLNIPDRSDQSYVDEACNWYRKVIGPGAPRVQAGAERVLYSPAAYRGLARASLLKDQRSTEPQAIARQCLRHYPAALDVRASTLWRENEAGGTPPSVWAPYTNLFDMYMPLDHDLANLRIAIAKARDNNPALVRAKSIAVASVLQWCRVLRSNSSSKIDAVAPYRYYTLEKSADYRFVLARQTFVVPVNAPQWYAVRSRFTIGDLKNGNTHWWRRQAILAEVNPIVTEAAMLQRHLSSSGTWTLASSWVYGIDLNERPPQYNPESAYLSELLRCFYDSGATRVYNQSSARLQLQTSSDGIKGSPLPYALRSAIAIPPVLRHLHVPAVCLDILPHTDRDRALQTIVDDGWATALIPSFSWPDNEAAARTWSSAQTASRIDADDRPVIFSVAASPVGSSTWASAGLVPMHRNAVAPQFPSPFASPLNGMASNIFFDVSWRNVTSTFSVAFVVTPAPMKRSVATWPDEAVAIEIRWPSPSNAVLNAYARTYLREDGIPLNKPGIHIASTNVPPFSSLRWRIDGTTVKIGTDSSPEAIAAPHNLSPFAWQQGCYFGIEFPCSERGFNLNIGGLHIGANQ